MSGCVDARLHRFDQLLVYKLDRLGRETRLTLEVVAELESCGVRVKSLTEEFDTATASGRLMLTLRFEQAAFYALQGEYGQIGGDDDADGVEHRALDFVRGVAYALDQQPLRCALVTQVPHDILQALLHQCGVVAVFFIGISCFLADSVGVKLRETSAELQRAFTSKPLGDATW